MPPQLTSTLLSVLVRVTMRFSTGPPSRLACLMLMSAMSGKSQKCWRLCKGTQLGLVTVSPTLGHPPPATGPHLGSTAAPGDAAFTGHVDDDVGSRAGRAHGETLLSPAPLQPLQVQQVLELQVPSVCLAAPDLPQGFAEAAPDALAGEEVVLLDLEPQRRRDAGLVAAGDGNVR